MKHVNNDPLLWELHLVDINNDLGFKKIASLIELLPDEAQPMVQKALRDIQEKSLDKEASAAGYLLPNVNKLPINNYSNILLSKVYLTGQESNIPAAIYKVASEKIDKLCRFFDIDTSIIKLNTELNKEASVKDYITLSINYLLPDEQLFPVASVNDLEKAASAYTANENKLLLEQKIKFARNFTKVAADYDVDNIPYNIAKYASILDSDLKVLGNYLEKRAAWIKVHSPESKMELDMLNKLASSFSANNDDATVNEFTSDINNLNKLAYLINNIDTAVGIGAKQYKTIFPDCFGTVFNKEASANILPSVGLGITRNDTDTSAYRDQVKEDTLANPTKRTTNITKAEILTNFGSDVLEDLLDEDGNLDQDRAFKLLKSIRS